MDGNYYCRDFDPLHVDDDEETRELDAKIKRLKDALADPDRTEFDDVLSEPPFRPASQSPPVMQPMVDRFGQILSPYDWISPPCLENSPVLNGGGLPHFSGGASGVSANECNSISYTSDESPPSQFNDSFNREMYGSPKEQKPVPRRKRHDMQKEEPKPTTQHHPQGYVKNLPPRMQRLQKQNDTYKKLTATDSEGGIAVGKSKLYADRQGNRDVRVPNKMRGDALLLPPTGWDDGVDAAGPSHAHRRSIDYNTKQQMFKDATEGTFSGGTYVDTHCHWDFIMDKAKCDTIEKFVKLNPNSWSKAYEGCIADFCEPGELLTQFGGYRRAILEHPTVLGAAYGCHPHWSDHFTEQLEEVIVDKFLEKDSRALAVGECGYDYSFKNDVPHSTQRRVFEKQCELSKIFDKPLLIHCRTAGGRDRMDRGDAETHCLDSCKKILSKSHPIHRHCFTLGMDAARPWLNEFPNLFIGLTPLIVNPGPRCAVMEVVRECPLDRLLIETDSPYFLPTMYRDLSMRNSHPGIGINVALVIAQERNLPVEKVLEQLRENTRNIYGV